MNDWPKGWTPDWAIKESNQISDKDMVHTPKDKKKSDGGSAEYYILPKHATELRHLMSYKAMSASRANIFKACYRLGEKEGVDILYDLNKMELFIQDLKEMHARHEHL